MDDQQWWLEELDRVDQRKWLEICATISSDVLGIIMEYAAPAARMFIFDNTSVLYLSLSSHLDATIRVLPRPITGRLPFGCRAVRHHDGHLYITGGNATRAMQIYHIATQTWMPSLPIPAMSNVRYGHVTIALPPPPSQPSPHPSASSAVVSTTTATTAGQIVVIGGAMFNSIGGNSVEVYDPNTEVWTALDTETRERRVSACGVYFNNAIYLFGGTIDALIPHEAFEECEMLVVGKEMRITDANEWKQIADAPFGRSNACAVVINDRIYVMGGITREMEMVSIDEYDPIHNKWSHASWELPVPMASFGAVYFAASHTLVVASVNGIYVRIHPLSSLSQWHRCDHLDFARQYFSYC